MNLYIIVWIFTCEIIENEAEEGTSIIQETNEVSVIKISQKEMDSSTIQRRRIKKLYLWINFNSIMCFNYISILF